nr:unnamed protein product [Callosobruchus chinensis]
MHSYFRLFCSNTQKQIVVSTNYGTIIRAFKCHGTENKSVEGAKLSLTIVSCNIVKSHLGCISKTIKSHRLIGDPALTCRLQPLSHRRAVGDPLLFYRYSNGFCSSELTSIIPPLSKHARCTRGTFSSHPKANVLHTSRTDRYDRTFVPRVSRAWNEF